jgi:colicin import membrane protein
MQEFLARLRVFLLAVGIHVLMVAVVVLGTMNWKPFRKPQNLGLTIEAVIVDTSDLRRQREEAQREAEDAVRRQEQKERRDRELEQQRQRREQEVEEQRKRDAAERLQSLRMERERKLEEERLKQQRELEQLREQREAAERQRKLEEERLKQLETRRQTEADEQRKRLAESEKQKQQEAEQRAFQAGQLATKKDEYVIAIQSLVTQNWLRPPTAQAGLNCTVHVVQIPGGEVISSNIVGRCNGDEATRRSIIAAVDRTGVLPYRGFEDVFEREINFNFIFDGD